MNREGPVQRELNSNTLRCQNIGIIARQYTTTESKSNKSSEINLHSINVQLRVPSGRQYGKRYELSRSSWRLRKKARALSIRPLRDSCKKSHQYIITSAVRSHRHPAYYLLMIPHQDRKWVYLNPDQPPLPSTLSKLRRSFFFRGWLSGRKAQALLWRSAESSAGSIQALHTRAACRARALGSTRVAQQAHVRRAATRLAECLSCNAPDGSDGTGGSLAG